MRVHRYRRRRRQSPVSRGARLKQWLGDRWAGLGAVLRGLRPSGGGGFDRLPAPVDKPQRPWWKKLLWWGCCAGVGVLVLLVAYAVLWLPSVAGAAELDFSESTVIYDRGALAEGANPEEHILYVIHGDENRSYVPLSDISPAVVNATLAIEDDQFYSHWGFDIGGIVKAVANRFFGIGSARGGSTITQQLVKNTFLSSERTLTRKLKEILLSVKVEAAYTKDQILEMYLNKVFYGSNAYGVEAAAQAFFSKSAKDITVAEASILASLINRPTYFSPYGNNIDALMGDPEAEKLGRKDLVLRRMATLGMITEEEQAAAVAEAAALEFQPNITDIRAPHFVFYVQQLIEDRYGKEFLKNGGLQIYTTLDPAVQTVAEDTVSERTADYASKYDATNAALVGINPDNGEILAYVGGRDYFDEENKGQVDVLTRSRQPGSSFKPMVYAAAFEQGYAPSTVVFDVETDFGGNYTPQNFDGKFSGPVSVRRALNASLNIPAVKMAYLAGVKNVIDFADKLGIKMGGTPYDLGVAVGIGVAEVEPLSHINAFTAFAGDGAYFEPLAILEVRNSEGKTLERFDDADDRKMKGIDPETAALVRNILTDESTRPTTNGFDWNKYLQLDGYNNAAKTGTSNRQLPNPAYPASSPDETILAPGDSWTVGFTPHLVAGVWVGNNNGSAMKPGATGMTVAAPIWQEFMAEAHAVLVEQGADPEKGYNEPKLLEVRRVNKFSGKLANENTPSGLVTEGYFASYNTPTEYDESLKSVLVDVLTGLPPTEETPEEDRQYRQILSLTSLQPEKPNWENPVQKWLAGHPHWVHSLGVSLGQSAGDKAEIERKLAERRERLAEDKIKLDELYEAQDAAEAQAAKAEREAAQRAQIDNIYQQPDPAPTTTGVSPTPVAPTNNGVKFGLLTPVDGARVGEGFRAQVRVPSGKRPINVEYLLNGELLHRVVRADWSKQLRVPRQMRDLPQVTLTARVKYSDGSTDEAKVTLKLGGEVVTPPPVTTPTEPAKPVAAAKSPQWQSPANNQQVTVGTSITLGVVDNQHDITSVAFDLGGVSLGTDYRQPWSWPLTVGGASGQQTLRAVVQYKDGEKVTITRNINVQGAPTSTTLQAETSLVQAAPRIASVRDAGEYVLVTSVIPQASTVEWVDLVVQQGGQMVLSQRSTAPTDNMIWKVQRTVTGNTEIAVRVKYRNTTEVTTSPIKVVAL